MSELEQEKKDITIRFENNPNKYIIQIDFTENSPSLEEQQKKYLESKSEELKITNYGMYSLFEINSGMFIIQKSDLDIYPEGTVFIMKNCSLIDNAINNKINELIKQYNNPESFLIQKPEKNIKKEKNEYDEFDIEENEEENKTQENIKKEKQNIESIKTKAMNNLKKYAIVSQIII